MVARMMIALLAMLLGVGLTGTTALAGEQSGQEAVLREDDADALVVVSDDDADGDGNTGNTGGGTYNSRTGNSNDGTNSRVTGVTRNRDRSLDDLTRDRTKDGPGGKKRDWSRHHTNDRSRNDSR
jgi:hypothetical protein